MRLEQVELIPLRHRALAGASVKGVPHQAEGREAKLTLERAPTPNVSRKNPINAKATPAHTNRMPTLNDPMLINPAQAKRQPQHIITRKQANAKAAVRLSNRNNDRKT